MSKSADVSVVGGGVIGTSVAYYASKDGHRVTVLAKKILPGALQAPATALSFCSLRTLGLIWNWLCRARPCIGRWRKNWTTISKMRPAAEWSRWKMTSTPNCCAA